MILMKYSKVCNSDSKGCRVWILCLQQTFLDLHVGLSQVSHIHMMICVWVFVYIFCEVFLVCENIYWVFWMEITYRHWFVLWNLHTYISIFTVWLFDDIWSIMFCLLLSVNDVSIIIICVWQYWLGRIYYEMECLLVMMLQHGDLEFT